MPEQRIFNSDQCPTMTRDDMLFDILSMILVETCKLQGIQIQILGGEVNEKKRYVEFEMNKNYMFFQETLRLIARVFQCRTVEYSGGGRLILNGYRVNTTSLEES